MKEKRQAGNRGELMLRGGLILYIGSLEGWRKI